ncbi:hypothetical protein D3C73_1059250 [compost metagenome]
MVVDDALAIAQGVRLQLLFGGRLVRVPDDPGIDAATLERGAGIGRRQVDGLYVAVLEAGLFQGADQQVVNVRTFVERNFLAFEFLHRLDRRTLRYKDRFTVRRRRFVGHIEQIGTGGLSEYRRRFTSYAKVDGADIQAFEQLRATWEFGPLHLDALIGQALFQRALGFEQHQGAVFLIADTQAFSLGLGNDAEGHSRRKQGDQTTTQEDCAHGALLCE